MTRVRSLFPLIAVAALVVGLQSFADATAQAGSDQTLSAASTASRRVGLSTTTRAILNAPADPGGSDITNLGANGWEVQSSAVATQSGAQISTPGFNTSTWLPVTNDDAGAPGTEIEALAQNGLCPGDTALQPVNQSTDHPDHGLAGPVHVSQ